MSHIGPAMQSWMDDLGDTRLTPQVQKQIIDGVAEEAGNRTIADLQRWRDRKLIDILKVAGDACPTSSGRRAPIGLPSRQFSRLRRLVRTGAMVMR